MTTEEQLKEQRDNFLAFAFASADLLIEIGDDGKILSAIGASNALTGLSTEKLKSHNWTDLFAKSEGKILKAISRKAGVGNRYGPVLMTMNSDNIEDMKAVLSAIKMPHTKDMHITLGFANSFMEQAGQDSRYNDTEILQDKEAFTNSAEQALRKAQADGKDAKMTLLDIEDSESHKEVMGEDAWDEMVESISSLLNTKSIDGKTAGELNEGKYGLVHGKDVNLEALQAQITKMAQEKSPEGTNIEIGGKTVDADIASLNEREFTRALVYTMNEFEEKGQDIDINNLSEGFKSFVTQNAGKAKELKRVIATLDFELNFQPIVSLENFYISHYEVLTRFEEGKSPYETIRFCEDIGMAPEMDLAVYDKTVQYIQRHVTDKHKKFAVNISGQSIQNDMFFSAFQERLKKHSKMADRLTFEITESTTISDLEKVNGFIKTLQDQGYKVSLDDFGAGSASFQYLHKLHVDYVKLDGMYTRKIIDDPRNATMVKSLVSLCTDLGVKMVAEMIDEEAQVPILQEMGVAYGQGYLFSKPLPSPIVPNELMQRITAHEKRTDETIEEEEKELQEA